MTFSEQIVYAMFKPSRYKELIKLKKGRFVTFVIVIMLVLGIVTFVIPAGALITGFGGFEKLFHEQLSTLTYSDGELHLDTPFRMDINGLTLIVNTDNAKVEDDQLKRNGVYIAMGSKVARMVVTIDGQVMEYQSADITGLFTEGFNCNSLVQMIPDIYMYIFCCFLVQCIGFFIKYGVIALLYSLFINSVNKNMSLNLTFGEVFQICFYGQTLGIILSNFNAALGLLPTTIVSIICIFISIHMVTTSVVLMNPRNQV